MKKGFITTVYNDEEGVAKLLDSLAQQTKLPDEIVVIDAESSDKTLRAISSYKKKFTKSDFKVYSKKGNRSVGRNYGIKVSKSNIIAISDSGCVLDKNWFERITKPFNEKGIDVVAGFYKPIVNNAFEKSLATYTCFPEDKVDENFLPSSRSVAFRKEAWEKVGGYPEELDTCEDLVFAKRLKELGFKFKVVKSALAHWPQRKNIFEAVRQFFDYAKGDGQALFVRQQTPLLFGRYVFVAILFISYFITNNVQILYFLTVLFLLYIIWSIFKNYKYVKKSEAVLFLPILQILSDIAVLSGFLVGLLKRYGI